MLHLPLLHALLIALKAREALLESVHLLELLDLCLVPLFR